MKKIVPRDPPWITKSLKTLLRRKNRLYKHYKMHGYREEDKLRLSTFREECKVAVEKSRSQYLTNLGEKINDPSTSQKCYWKVLNRVMNKCRVSKIPPILVGNTFVFDCEEKARLFNDYFARQCKIIENESELPPLEYHTHHRINNIIIDENKILPLIRNLNPNKAMGSDGISGKMLLICDQTVVLPLTIIFRNILASSTYPDIWKLANIILVFKKEKKELVNNYRPISLLPIRGKLFEKNYFR